MEFAKPSKWRKRKQYIQGLLKGWWSVHDKYHYYTCTVSMVKAHEAGHAAGTWSGETLGFEGI